MNKKLLLTALCMLLPLTSCTNDGMIDIQDKILTYKSEYVDAPIVLQTLDELNNIVRHDDVILYVYSSSCSSCSLLEDEILEYIAETHIIIYQVDINLYTEAYQSVDNSTGSYAYLYPQIKGTPTLLFYRGGQLKNAVVNGISVGSFKSTVEKYIVDYNYYSLNTYKKSGSRYYLYQQDEDESDDYFSTSVLDEFLSENEEATILFTWRSCSDCSEYKSYVLEPYLYETGKKIYYFETDNFALARRSDDEAIATLGSTYWSNLTSKFHLDYGSVDSYGNFCGVVPSIISYNKDGYELSIFRNDSGYLRDEEGKLYYETSFYDEVKALRSNTTVEEGDSTSSSYQKAISELREKAFDLEKELCTTFLEEHL